MAGPYTGNREFLEDYTTLLRLKLHREVEAARARREGKVAVPDMEADDDRGDAPDGDAGTFEVALRQRAADTQGPLPAWRLARTFGLSERATELLLTLLVSGLDERFGRVFAYLNEDAARRWLTAGLAWRLLGLDALSSDAHALFAPDSPLIAQELVRVLPGERGMPPAGNALALDDRIAAYLLDLDVLDERIGNFTALVLPDGSCSLDGFEPAQARRLMNLCRTWGQDLLPPVCFQGPPGAGKHQAARYVAGELGRALLVVDAGRLPQSLAAADDAWRYVRREQRLREAIVYVRDLDVLEAGVYARLLRDAGSGTVFGVEGDLTGVHRGEHAVLTIDFPVPEHRLRRARWLADMSGGEPAGESTSALANELAGRFRLTTGQIDQAAAAARRLAALRDGPGSSPDREDYFEGARSQSVTNLGSMATKVTSARRWEDLVLPPAVRSKLKAIVSQVRNAATVYEKWGFAAGERTGKGLAVLFSGPSGTGKTMSAGVIARELGLDMYKIDLARVVSKYIGETEKNLDRVFSEAVNANAVLFFDEADALFGKRSEVKDAHDRYANIEISYLLQKMEEYEGLAVLATNFGQNLDEAFNRRLAFIVEFPLPNAADRASIWRNHMPPRAPVEEGIDFDFLAAQFELTGGSIRNCVRAAAFTAAEAGTRIGMEHLVQAVAAELAKLGRPLQRSDFGEYFGSVTEARRGRAAVSNGNGWG